MVTSPHVLPCCLCPRGAMLQSARSVSLPGLRPVTWALQAGRHTFKLCDLGLCARAGWVMPATGTDDYMPPELLRPGMRAVVSATQDTWGLGATLLEVVLVGVVRWGGLDSLQPRLEQLPQAGVNRLLAGLQCGEELTCLLHACLQVDPRLRPHPSQLLRLF